ncbi:MAG: LytTR family transcriptional regulator DNA-binding domain-containing protein [Spirochaetaceae bacterium]|nr:LytTR family transcriptional regulator DNA-binding domain-containing protein [Spirochaetaceae bacterium]
MPRIPGWTTERGLWGAAYREFLAPRTIAIAIASVALFVLAMTIFGPLGTLETLRPLRRAAYWGLCAAVTFPICYALAAVVLYLTRRGSLVQMLPAAAASVLFEGVVCTTVVETANMLFRPAYVGLWSPVNTYLTVTIVVAVCTFFVHFVVFQRIRSAAAAAAEPPAPGAAPPSSRDDATRAASSGAPPEPHGSAGTPGETPPGDAVRPSAGANAGAKDGDPVPDRPPDEAAAPAPAATPPGATPPGAGSTAPASERSAGSERPTARQAQFYDRLSLSVSRDIIYLKVDDHYVNVYTTGGSCLVLMRFADAVADLGDLGMQVHRSYWAAHRHMRATVRREGRTMLRLTGGAQVPISRPYLPAVRAALRATQHRSAPGGHPE